jgi:hypothetical protein
MNEMASEKTQSIPGFGALRQLTIQDFKAIDWLNLEFPQPRFEDEPDIWVLGSRNGLGKTSIFQAISMLFVGGYFPPVNRQEVERELGLEFGHHWVRAGAECSRVKGVFERGEASFRLDRRGVFEWKFDIDLSEGQKNLRECLLALTGQIPDPLLLPGLLFFHSYRQVQEGNPDFSQLLDGLDRAPYAFGRKRVLSIFKAELLKLMMGKADLFESVDTLGGSLAKFENLLAIYANARLGKLKPDRAGALDIRLLLGDSQHTISFDGLSSGQKEMVSTLFLLDSQSRGGRSRLLCLVDEPELHLNAEWHAQFVRDICKFAPGSQFLLASHSERIFSAVDPAHRILLERE